MYHDVRSDMKQAAVGCPTISNTVTFVKNNHESRIKTITWTQQSLQKIIN